MADKDSEEYLKYYGERAFKLRKDKNWSLQTLHETSGLHSSVLSNIENGKKEISFRNKQKLYKGLGVTDFEFHNTPELRAFTGAPAFQHLRQCPMPECKMLCFDCDKKEDISESGEIV
ncbi:MAG: helix-turn-helix transcriptional regulator [Bacteroidota bacterium]